MKPEQLLQQLRPIHLPPPPGWWPLAPGWWILLAISLSILFFLIYFLIQHYRKNLWRRQAFIQLQWIIETPMTPQKKLTEVVQLIKRVAGIRYKKKVNLTLTGEEWCDFLRQQPAGKWLKKGDYDSFATGIYRSDIPDINDEMFHRIKKWIEAGS